MQDFTVGGWIGLWAQQIAEFANNLVAILRALPDSPGAFLDTARQILTMRSGDHSPITTLLQLVVCGALVFAPRVILRIWPVKPWFTTGSRYDLSIHGLLADGLDVGAALLVATLSAALIFSGTVAIDQFAVAVLWGATRWRISMRGIEIFLRPSRPELRLVAVGDDTARTTMLMAGVAFALALGFVTIVPVFLNHGLPLINARACALVLSTLDCLLAIAAVRRFAADLPADRRLVLWVGTTGALTLWAIWVGSVVALDFTLYDAFTKTATIVWIVVGLYCVGGLASQPRDSAIAPSMNHGQLEWLVDSSVRRGLLVTSAVIGISLVGRDWLVDVFELVTPDQWPAISRASNLALAVSVIGYLCYEALRTWSGVKFGLQRATLVPGVDHEDDERHSGSRLATILPVFSRILLASSLGLAALLGLANLGVNIGPILAGAGIFGLAISFGSQALVRDIVSGFFFILDDAFRVGEYIDTGRQKGTVERISLRSFRLRHQNGQVHTVPYGQLGAVTNFSRDWATVKFNLRLARDSDLEIIRKITKRAGQAMLDDSEIGSEFLVPLKLQGVADVQETALVLRFKFTVRPVKASFVQREAVRRLYLAFKEQGIEFATNAVFVQTDTGRPIDPAVGAAALQTGTQAEFRNLERGLPKDRASSP